MLWFKVSKAVPRSKDRYINKMKYFGLVAQLVERRIRIAEVRGSTPLESTNRIFKVLKPDLV